MAIFAFNTTDFPSDPAYLGTVMGSGHQQLTLEVPEGCETRASVGQLVVFPLELQDFWLVGLIDRLMCGVPNTAAVSLVGTVRREAREDGLAANRFTRSLAATPAARSPGFALHGESLGAFMQLLAQSSDRRYALVLGQYTLDANATAYLDGDRFFQRHGALLGSTGSGKSWTVATLLERAAQLPSASLVVFDLHGEYSRLGYARQLRVPGPDDLQSPDPDLLFLPYWLMTTEELAATFVDLTEATAHDQTLVLQREIGQAKRDFLAQCRKEEALRAFTVDSPIPFPLETVRQHLDVLNTKVVQDYRGSKPGEFHGMFGRLLVRMNTRRADRRYGFLFQAPEIMHTYEAFGMLARQLLDFQPPSAQVRIIDFSEVPTDILPIMLGIVARLIYYLQFWTPKELRHPLAMVCEEAHLYLPSACANANEERALACFQKIAKEGRKYGVSLVVVSQRPADVDTTILSQCNNVLAMRLSNAQDQNVVRKMMPDSLGALLEMLPILDTGEVLAVGDAMLLPSRVRVTPPSEKPVSSTVNFWSEWSRTDCTPDWELAAENMRRQRRLGRGV
jgi:hypothetical protein